MPPVAAEPSSDSELDADEEYGIQNREISSNKCAICFGLYQDDLSTTGKLMRERVELAPKIGARSGFIASDYKKTMTFMCVKYATVYRFS